MFYCEVPNGVLEYSVNSVSAGAFSRHAHPEPDLDMVRNKIQFSLPLKRNGESYMPGKPSCPGVMSVSIQSTSEVSNSYIVAGRCCET